MSACTAIPTGHAGSQIHANSTDVWSGLLSSMMPLYSLPDLLEQNEPLALSLSEMLIPSLAAAAVALQLPPERRPPGCSWRATAEKARVLTVAGLGCCNSLARKLSSGSGPVAKLLPTAVQLLQHAPLPAFPAGGGTPDECLLWDRVASLGVCMSLGAEVHVRALQVSQQSHSSGLAAFDCQPAEMELLAPLIPRLAVILKAFLEHAQARLQWPLPLQLACLRSRGICCC